MFKKGDLVRIINPPEGCWQWFETESNGEIQDRTDIDITNGEVCVVHTPEYITGRDWVLVRNFRGHWADVRSNNLQLIKEQDHDDPDQPRFAGEPEHQPVDGPQAGPHRD